ncbi:MAG: oligoendopeptidase F [Opitutaceae bacterium]
MISPGIASFGLIRMNIHRLLPCLLALSPLISPALFSDEAPAKTVDPATTWNTSLLFKDDAAYAAAKDQIAAGIEKILSYKGRLGESSKMLLEAFDCFFNTRKEAARLEVYAGMLKDENLKNAAALERAQELDMLMSRLSQAASYIDPELLSVGEAKLKAFLDAEPKLAQYRFPIMETLRLAPHTLGAEAENVMSATAMITNAPEELYSILSTADVTWPRIKLSDGTEATLNQSGYTRFRAVNNRDDRKAVYEAFWPKFKEYENTYGVALFSQMKSHWFAASIRKYPNSLGSAQAGDAIPEAVYRTLIAETNANLPTLHRYLKLRGRMLGIKDLHYWDMYPPIVKLEKKFSYADAKALLIDALKPLGEGYVSEIKDCIDGRYTHVYPQPGKRSGAYANGGAYDVHAFVLLNFNDNYESVSTFAHEWGHGMHSQLANRSQPFPLSRYSTFTAEIASTLNEALLLEHMMQVAKTDEERLYYLGSALENLRQTFFRQAMFAEFELAIHEEVEKGGALSGPKLTKLYGDILRRYHGHDKGIVTIDDLVTIEWAYIPHFYYDFYVYQYATSITASQAFAERILDKEPGAVETYLGLLKAGGSDNPYELVKRAGVDLATPAPYRALVSRMNSIMDRIENILGRQRK